MFGVRVFRVDLGKSPRAHRQQPSKEDGAAVSRRRHSMRNVGRYAALAAVMMSVWVQRSEAQFSLSNSQRAADGTVYEVLVASGTFSGAEELRVTTVAGSPNGLGSCSNANNGLSAMAGADPTALQVLHPFSQIRRTAVLTPSNVSSVSFNPSNGGRLTIGTGGGAVDVCRVSSDCAGGATDAGVVTLDTADSTVPAACVASNVTATACGATSRTTIAFGLPRNSTTNACTSGAPTTNLAICGARPSDGFTVGQGQVIVFIYNHSLANSGFTYGAGGFGIDTDGTNNPHCSAGQAVTADAQTPSAPPPIPPNCGDGIVSPPEECDDGNQTNGDTCDNNCTKPRCGNGIVDAGEECDDGNQTNGDGCNNNCRVQGESQPPPGKVAPAMSPLGGLLTMAGLLLAGSRVLRRSR
ncbi:MAG: DUF4215 domain-containing protein [Deltaproteobacteria bacterium]|nr:DUF4215 domain-containing protein [Deltaproteobacteria bacterium]